MMERAPIQGQSATAFSYQVRSTRYPIHARHSSCTRGASSRARSLSHALHSCEHKYRAEAALGQLDPATIRSRTVTDTHQQHQTTHVQQHRNHTVTAIMKLAILSIFLSVCAGTTSAQLVTIAFARGSACTGTPRYVSIDVLHPMNRQSCKNAGCDIDSVMTECVSFLENPRFHDGYIAKKFGVSPYVTAQSYKAQTDASITPCATEALYRTDAKLADGSCVLAWAPPVSITINPVDRKITSKTYASTNPTCTGTAFVQSNLLRKDQNVCTTLKNKTSERIRVYLGK